MPRLHGPEPPQGVSPFGSSLLTLPPHLQYSPPQGIAAGGISPGVDSELFDEAGIQGSMIFDDGTETGFILVQET